MMKQKTILHDWNDMCPSTVEALAEKYKFEIENDFEEKHKEECRIHALVHLKFALDKLHSFDESDQLNRGIARPVATVMLQLDYYIEGPYSSVFLGVKETHHLDDMGVEDVFKSFDLDGDYTVENFAEEVYGMKKRHFDFPNYMPTTEMMSFLAQIILDLNRMDIDRSEEIEDDLFFAMVYLQEQNTKVPEFRVYTEHEEYSIRQADGSKKHIPKSEIIGVRVNDSYPRYPDEYPAPEWPDTI